MYDEYRNFNKIKVWNENGEFTIKIPQINLSMDEMINDLIVPMLKSVGYAEANIKEYINQG